MIEQDKINNVVSTIIHDVKITKLRFFSFSQEPVQQAHPRHITWLIMREHSPKTVSTSAFLYTRDRGTSVAEQGR